MPSKKKKDEGLPIFKDQNDKNVYLFDSVRYGMMAEANKAIKAGADVNARNSKGACPLHIAVAMHYKDTALMLLDLGADANVRDNSGIAPLNIAAYNGDNGIALALLTAGAKPDEPDSNGTTPLFMAVGSGNKDLAKALLVAGADTKRTILDGLALLHVVAFMGDIELAKMVLDKGAELNPLTSKDMDQYPANNTPFDLSILQGNSEMTAFLKKNGGRPASELARKKRSK